MDIRELSTAGATPVLERLMAFAGQRQRLIAHNIANLSTPGYQPLDASPTAFARSLRDAVERRREATGGDSGELDLKSSGEVEIDADGRLSLKPRTPSGNVLFHDRNSRDLERTMQDLVENLTVFRVASDLLRSRYAMLNSAIAERV